MKRKSVYFNVDQNLAENNFQNSFNEFCNNFE